jgi:hypothetical protein
MDNGPMKQTIIPTLLAFFCLQTTVDASSQWWDSGSGSEWYEEGPAWKESKVTIPDYPQEQKLIEFSVDNPATRNHHYFLDPQSLSLAEDYVIRYSVVVQTRSGTSNVFYDGIRCTTNEYKNYAFGVGGNFIENKSAAWGRIKGGDFFRKALLRGVVCNRTSDSPYRPEEIVDRIKYNR